MNDMEGIKKIVEELDTTYASLASSSLLDEPVWSRTKQQFRHANKHDCILVHLKGVRVLSLLHALIVLYEAGHFYEMGILCRCIDETIEDIFLFPRNLGPDGGPSNIQMRVMSEFYQEQFEDIVDPILKSNKRDRVSRDKIRATIANFVENKVNTHDHIHLNKTVYETFSGYVHGAYPHIMETYGGNPPHYHTKGMKETPRVYEWRKQLVDYVYRSILGASFVAKRLGEINADQSLLTLRLHMERRYPYLAADPNELITRLKKRSSV
jgi:hypothetical protein